MRLKFYQWLAGMVTTHPGKMLFICAVFTLAMLVATGRLKMKTQFADMLPEDIPQIKEFLEIIEDYSSESTAMITIESASKNTARMKECAEDMAARLKTIRHIKPAENARPSLKQKIALMKGETPEGLPYDTIGLVRRIDYKVDNDFFAEHGMIIQKQKDLESFVEMFQSIELSSLIKNINDNFEKEYIEDSESLTTLDGEGEAVQGLEGIRKFLLSIEEYIIMGDTAAAARAVSDFITGPQYMLAPDNSMLLIMLQPSVSWNEYDEIIELGYRIDDTLNAVRSKYPDLKISRTGAMMWQIDENYATKKDFGWPSLFALCIILIILIGSFRTWKNPFFSVVTLVIALIWVTGFLALTLHFLDVMSAGFGIVLIGLGIDFGIHYISGFRDGREQGLSVRDALFYMYTHVGAGVSTGAMTTAVVFFSLLAVRFEGFEKMSKAMGVGILVTLFCMTVLLPVLIAWDHKGYSLAGNFLRKIRGGFIINLWTALWKGFFWVFKLPVFTWFSALVQFTWLEKVGHITSRKPTAALLLLASMVLGGLSLYGGMNIKFEYDMAKQAPQNTESIKTQNLILDKFEFSPDYAMLKADNMADCREKVKKFKRMGNRTGLIGQVDAISEFMPPIEEQQENIPLIEAFRRRMEETSIPQTITPEQAEELSGELERLHNNIVEIGELSIMGSGEKNKIIRKCDQIVGKENRKSHVLNLAQLVKDLADIPGTLGEYQKIMAEVLRERLITMASTDIVTMDNLPHDIRNRYVNPKNDDLLVSIYPKGYIWDELKLRRFFEKAAAIDPAVTGMPAIMLVYIDLMKEKGLYACLLGAAAILAFLLMDYRSLTLTVFSTVPLAFGAIWMVGLMALIGMKFSVSNFMALPLILGIGIDDGVHILHRYRIEGRGSIPLVIKYTGRAILLTSITTMIGFGSMGLASHKGVAALGQVLFLGVGSCFLSSVIVLPALITLFEGFIRLEGGKSEIRSQKGGERVEEIRNQKLECVRSE